MMSVPNAGGYPYVPFKGNVVAPADLPAAVDSPYSSTDPLVATAAFEAMVYPDKAYRGDHAEKFPLVSLPAGLLSLAVGGDFILSIFSQRMGKVWQSAGMQSLTVGYDDPWSYSPPHSAAGDLYGGLMECPSPNGKAAGSYAGWKNTRGAFEKKPCC